MNLLGTARAARDADFISRVQAAVIITAVAIINDPSQYMTPRQSFALQTTQQPDYARDGRFIWLAAANPAIAASVDSNGTVTATDNDIHYVVSGLWHLLFPTPTPSPEQ